MATRISSSASATARTPSKRYFLDYSECASNDFVLSQGGRKVELFNSDIHDWRITFRRYRHQLQHRPAAEGGRALSRGRRRNSSPTTVTVLPDLPLPQQLDHFHRNKKVASFLCVLPNLSYHVVSTEPGSSLVTGGPRHHQRSVRINGGYFAFKKEDLRLPSKRAKSSSSNRSSG